MQQIKFNNPKILKALLDKTKTTTIRKAWKYKTLEKVENKMLYSNETIDKPCKYKVGEIVEVVWKKDSCHKYFKKDTGEAVFLENFGLGMSEILDDNLFNKNLGKIKITKIEKIWIKKHIVDGYFISDREDTQRYYLGSNWIERLSKSEGFKSPEEMFKFLEEYARDLSEAKPFWLVSFEESKALTKKRTIKCQKN